jgi:renalase
MPQQVAIVGAGLAGLSCAITLVDAGVDVTIYDKGRHHGGRLASRDRDEQVFDYGAQYFTARDERFIQFLAPLIDSGKVARWSGRFARRQNEQMMPDTSTHSRYVGVPVMRSLADAMLDTRADGTTGSLTIKLAHRVLKVARKGAKWSINGTLTSQDEPQDFNSSGYDHLILNMPPAQAMDLYPHPQLPERYLQPCFALSVSFDKVLDIPFDGINLDDQILSWVARDSSKPGRPDGERWMLHASPDWSNAQWLTYSSTITKAMLERFSTVFDITLADTCYSKLHKWKYALPVTPLADGCITEPDLALVYCGDWCQGARVESAYLSGITAAAAVLRDPG